MRARRWRGLIGHAPAVPRGVARPAHGAGAGDQTKGMIGNVPSTALVGSVPSQLASTVL